MAIYIPSAGGISTKDATALPSDVAKDKIFYNANGRQIGSYNKPPMEIKSIILPETKDGNYDSGEAVQCVRYEIEESSYNTELIRNNYTSYYYYSIIQGITNVIAVQINDNPILYCGTVAYESSVIATMWVVYGSTIATFEDGKLHVGWIEGDTITFYYV